VTVLDARRAIAGMTAAVEIVDSRFADWRIKLADTVADLASNGAVAISSRVVPLDGPETLTPRLNRDVLTGRASWSTRARARPPSATRSGSWPGSRTPWARWGPSWKPGTWS